MRFRIVNTALYAPPVVETSDDLAKRIGLPAGERTVRGRVTVPTYDGHAGLGVAQLGTHDVHDTLMRAVDVVKGYAELGAVLP